MQMPFINLVKKCPMWLSHTVPLAHPLYRPIQKGKKETEDNKANYNKDILADVHCLNKHVW